MRGGGRGPGPMGGRDEGREGGGWQAGRARRAWPACTGWAAPDGRRHVTVRHRPEEVARRGGRGGAGDAGGTPARTEQAA